MKKTCAREKQVIRLVKKNIFPFIELGNFFILTKITTQSLPPIEEKSKDALE